MYYLLCVFSIQDEAFYCKQEFSLYYHLQLCSLVHILPETKVSSFTTFRFHTIFCLQIF